MYQEVQRFNGYDRLIEMKVSPQARKRNPELPEYWQVRAVSYELKGQLKTVFTSLPFQPYSTEQVAQLYQERYAQQQPDTEK